MKPLSLQRNLSVALVTSVSIFATSLPLSASVIAPAPELRLRPAQGLILPPTLIASDAATAKIIKPLVETDKNCEPIPFEYRLDCVLQGYKQAVRNTPNNRDYRAMKSDLSIAQRKLNRLVKANLDKEAPPLKVGNKTYRAVKKNVAESLNAQATQILEETATKLIRSAGSSKKRQIHYARVADAVHSNKKIFRS